MPVLPAERHTRTDERQGEPRRPPAAPGRPRRLPRPRSAAARGAPPEGAPPPAPPSAGGDRKSTRLNSSHVKISYAVFCLKKKQRHECDGGRAVGQWCG